MVMVVVVVMMMHGEVIGAAGVDRSRGARRRGGFLGNGVSRQADGENGGAYESS